MEETKAANHREAIADSGEVCFGACFSREATDTAEAVAGEAQAAHGAAVTVQVVSEASVAVISEEVAAHQNGKKLTQWQQ